MNETIVLYHGGCRDGFASAWVVNKYFTGGYSKYSIDLPEIKYIPAFYGQEPPDCKDKNVIIVDFCYPIDTMIHIMDNCKSLTWLDHHKTAQGVADYFNNNNKTNVYFIFDNSRSGAGITWDYYFNELRPWIVNYVEDRDLWLHKLKASNMINAYIACLEFDFGVWETHSQLSLSLAEEFGQIAEMKTEQYVREVCKNVYFVDLNSYDRRLAMEYCHGKNIPAVNISQVDCSEVLSELLKQYPKSPFSLYWFKRADEMYQYGLRSRNNEDIDVSSIAKLFNGGGHKHAAGFVLNYLLEELK